MKKLLSAFFLLICFVFTGACAQANSAPNVAFEGGISSPVVLLDKTEYNTQNKQSINAKTADVISISVTLTGADENTLYLTLENRDSRSVNVVIPDCTVNGIFNDRYREWTVPGNSTEEVEWDLTHRAMRWLGASRLETLFIEELHVVRTNDSNWEGFQLIEKNLSFTFNEPTLYPEYGYVLWESELGKLTLLGVDYDDAPYVTSIMLRIDNAQPDTPHEWLPNYIQQHPLSFRVSAVSVNNRAVKTTSAFFGVAGIGSAIDSLIIHGSEPEEVPVDDTCLSIEKIEDITLRIACNPEPADYSSGEEVTLHLAELNLRQYAAPGY